MKKLLSFIVIFLPWKIKRFLLVHVWKYEIHPTARIGLSYIFPKKLIMEEGAWIGMFNVAIHLDKIHMYKNSTIGRSNWITGFHTGTGARYFAHDKERRSELIIGKETAITKNHHFDCTNRIMIGDFVTIAGYRSQFLTHSVDVYKNRQDSHPIIIGDYCFVSTSVVILGGATLPAYSVLAAGAVLGKKYEQEWIAYGGVPARPIKEIPRNALYFSRKERHVY